MITEIELRKALLDTLKKKYPTSQYKYYGIEVTEGLTRPSFFVDVRLLRQQDATLNIIEKEYTVTITYFAEQVNEVDYLTKVEEIKELLRSTDKRKRKPFMGLTVKNKYIRINNFHYDYTGEANNILQILFDFSFLEFDERTEEAMLMRSVSIKSE